MSEYICELIDPKYEMECAPKEEIVRCRDCKKCNIGWCLHFNNIVKPDGFCAWGIKKEVGAHFWRCECGAENYGFETCQYCGRSERC